jgi:hypothetical protein|tara:strand:+ start:327 stop:488 length:162 start_codon:yes stop_codon:yes gene_type:complete
MAHFMEKNLNGNRKQLYRLLHQGVFQVDNTAAINTESLRLQTAKQVEEVENPE